MNKPINKTFSSRFQGVQNTLAQIKKPYYRNYGKRIIDLIVAILLLPVFTPIIGFLAILIAIDGGSPFFGHVRVGRGGRKFRCWKLRSMKIGAEQLLVEITSSNPELHEEWLKYQKIRLDPRVTRVGKYIRRLRIDELPQIYNVIVGDLSFVGPRPFTPEQECIYKTSHGLAYYNMRPGLTGTWQVAGEHHAEFVNRVEFDETYFRNMSFALDAKIIIKTILIFAKFNGK